MRRTFLSAFFCFLSARFCFLFCLALRCLSRRARFACFVALRACFFSALTWAGEAPFATAA
jgi:hypothetical protein